MFSLLRSPRRRTRPRRFHVEQLEDRLVLSYVPFTPEFAVNPGAVTGISTPDIADAADDSGNFVVAWSTDRGDGRFNVVAQLFSRDATPLTSRITVASSIPAPPATALAGASPIKGVPVGVVPNPGLGKAGSQGGVSVDVAMTPGGDFVIVYDAGTPDGKSSEVRADFFKAGGTFLGETVLAPSPKTPFIQSASSPSVALDGFGNAYVTFLFMDPAAQTGIVVETVRPGNGPPGQPVVLSDPRDAPLTPPSIGADSVGNVVVAWNADLDQGPNVVPGIVFRQIAASNPIPTNFRPVSPADLTSVPDVGVARDTSAFVVTWDVGTGIFAEQFAPNGQPTNAQFQVNQTPANAELSSHVAVAANGNFAVSWTDSASQAVFVQVFNADGSPASAVISANEQSVEQGPSDIAVDGSLKTFVLGWSSVGQLGKGAPVVGRVFVLGAGLGGIGGGLGGIVIPGGFLPQDLILANTDTATLIALVRAAQRDDSVAEAFRLLRFRLLPDEVDSATRLAPEESLQKTPIFLLSSAGEEEPQLGAIHGKVFVDANGNGTQDEGERGLPGQLVFLDMNNNGIWDVGEPFCETDAEGRYAFSGLGLMRYNVRQNLRRARIAQTTPLKNSPQVVELTKQIPIVNQRDFGTKILRATTTSTSTDTSDETPQENERSSSPQPPPEE